MPFTEHSFSPLQTIWCTTLNNWVQFLDVQEVLGSPLARVIAPPGTVQCVALSSLTPDTPLDSNALWQHSRPLLARARLWEALTGETPLAPLLSRVIPLPHQFRILRCALARYEKERAGVRLLLADEVGLGKTIEAGLVQQELKLRGVIERTLIVAPKSLLLQWASEMEEHFSEKFTVIEPGRLMASEGENGWLRYSQAIVSLDSVKPLGPRAGWTRERIDRYNLERFHDLVGAGWDLVIFDEAHKVAGSGADVARHELARSLARVTPHLLLLSATPHSGHSEAFARLLSLLDPNRFGPSIQHDKSELRQYVLRTEKRTTTDADGNALFMPRTTELVVVPFQAHHAAQERLYEAVSEYVLVNYGRAEGGQGSRLLLILLQRLVSSSTLAILRFLEGRLQTLRNEQVAEEQPADNQADGAMVATAQPHLLQPKSYEEDEWPDDDSEAEAALLLHAAQSTLEELQATQSLLDLARATQAEGPDARAEALLDRMLHLANRDGEPDKKFLIFTEWTVTQEMLCDFLTLRGYKVVLLNGSMTLAERKSAQEAFRGESQVLVSTDAGGEGLNLQFAHVVFNYDLPWNPMRLEQRIGRVDRIGQKKRVEAFNLALQNSVEARLYEVLSEKLTRIFKEFGVDKTADVLDSREASTAFDALARAALLRPQTFESEAERLLVTVRQAAQEGQETRALAAPLATEDRIPQLPIVAWLQTARLPEQMPQLSFGRYIAEITPAFAPDTAVPALEAKLGFEIEAWFGLWKISETSPLTAASTRSLDFAETSMKILPVCVNSEGRSFARSARLIWDALCHPDTEIEAAQSVTAYPFEVMKQTAEVEAQPHFSALRQALVERIRWQKELLSNSHLARQTALRQIQSGTLRASREEVLRHEFLEKSRKLTDTAEMLPNLECLFLARIISR